MNVARSNYTYLVRGSTKLEVIALSEISVALGRMSMHYGELPRDSLLKFNLHVWCNGYDIIKIVWTLTSLLHTPHAQLLTNFEELIPVCGSTTWASGLDRSGLYYEGVVDDVETLETVAKLIIHQRIRQSDIRRKWL